MKTTACSLSLLASATALLGGCPDQIGSSHDGLERISHSGPVIQAHRGGGDALPENTLPTFEWAWHTGVIPEADVRATRDGVIVAFHDNDFARLVKTAPNELKSRGIADLSWYEVANLDVGAYKGEAYAGQRVPRIEDVFRAMAGRPGRGLYLDVKNVLLEDLATMARRYHVQRQLVLASTDDSLVRRWKELLPDSQTLLWMGGSEARLTARIGRLEDTNFAGVTQLQIHVRVGDLSSNEPFTPSSSFIRSLAERLRKRNILFQALPLDCRDRAVYGKLMDLGVQSFASDQPEMALRAVLDHTR